MPHRSRLLVFALVVLLALVATAATAARTHQAAALRVTVDITAAGHDEVATPANLAVRRGGSTTLVLRNHTHLFHTFTIPALGISVLVRPATSHGAWTTSVTFIAPYGVYAWQCLLCDSPTHPHMHAMAGKVYAIVNA